MNLEEITEFVDEEIVSGISAAFIRNEKSVKIFYGQAGKLALFSQQPVDSTAIYDLASLTKVVGTTTRILQLIDLKKLTLETRCCEILRDFSNLDCTIQELLLHRSGLPADFSDKDRFTDEIVKDFFRTIQLDSKETSYSDLGYLLLGWIIERIDGCNLEESFQKNIFYPLGMENTSYFPAEDSFFVPTEMNQKRGLIVGQVHDSKAFHFSRPIGSAGLFSTLGDMILFAEAILNNRLDQTHQLFSNELYELFSMLNINGRTLGWEKPFDDREIIYHTGFTGTSIGLDLQAKRGLIILSNRIHPSRDNQRFIKKRAETYKKYFEVN